MENSAETGSSIEAPLDLRFENGSMVTVDESSETDSIDEVVSQNVNNDLSVSHFDEDRISIGRALNPSVSRTDEGRTNSQGLYRAPLQISVNDIRGLTKMIREQIEAEKSREELANPLRLLESRNLSENPNNSHNENLCAVRGSDLSALKLIVDLIPTFDGFNISVQSFSRECRFAEGRVSPSLRPFLVKLLKTKIKGEAELYTRNMHFENLDDLLNNLDKIFGAHKTLFQIQSELANMKQNLGESVLSYGARAMELFSKMVELTQKQSPADIAAFKIREYDSEVASCFCLGLRGELESRVRQRNPLTLQEAVNLAVEANRELNRRKRLYGEIDESSPSTSREGTDNPNNRDPITKKPRLVYNIKGERTQSQNKTNKLTCYNCGKENHISRNCPDRKYKSSDTRHRVKTEEIKRENLDYRGKHKTKCDYCSGLGHTQVKCFLRRAEEAEKRLDELQRAKKVSVKETSGSLNFSSGHRPSTSMSRQAPAKSNN